MEVYILLFAILGVSAVHCADPETKENALQLIQHWGYHGEQHPVVTSDGYILQVQRIPYGKSGPTPGRRPVIFMQHGLLCSSTNWLTNLPNESAAFIFADKGYDVWLGNFRGNTYGTGHIKYSNKDKIFWEFTWDQMGQYDLEAMINYALQATGEESLYLMAHSEGTLASFAKFSSDLPFGNKVRAFFALGPFVTVKHIKGAIAVMAPFTKTLGTRIPVYLSHTPAGTSTRNMLHFGQMVKSGQFQKYDYGSSEENYKHYGESTPPLYHLNQMEVPTYLFWGDNDWAADPQGIVRKLHVRESILPVLKSIKGSFELPEFNHLDFIWGMRAPTAVYDKIISIIETAYES